MPIGTSDGQYFENIYDYHKRTSDAKEMAANETSGDFQSRFGASETAPRMPPGASEKLTGALKQEGGTRVAKDTPENGNRGVWDKLTGSDGGERYQLWPEKVVRSAVEAFQLPGDVFAGKITPDDPKYIEKVNDLAGLMVFGPAPVAKSMAEGTLGSFVGVQSKTFDKTRLARAQEMEAKGSHPDEIWKETQTMRGFEGRWKQEISDKNMKLHNLNLRHEDEMALSAFVNHPELFKAYPEIAHVKFKVDNTLPYMGSFSLGKNELSVNLSKIKSNEELMDVITHELQHKIQRKEGFALGTNPDSAFEDAFKALRKKIDDPSTDAQGRREASALYVELMFNKKQMRNVLYESNPGEAEANLSMASRKLSDNTRSKFSPNQRQEYIENTTNPVSGGVYRKPSYYGVDPNSQ